MPQSRRRLAAPFMLATLLFMALGAAAFARPNLIQNGGFEHDTSAWTSKGTLTWAPNDANGNLLSGVGKITNSVLVTAFAGGSCVTVTPGEDLVVGGALWVQAGSAGDHALVGVTFYSSDDCDHNSTGFSIFAQEVTSAGWHRVSRHFAVPAGKFSVSIALTASRGPGASGTLLAYYDDIFLQRGICVPGDTHTALCLNDERFEVKATWTANGQTGSAAGARLTDDSGNFWFFSPENIELDVKVLDGCGTNNRYWVFIAGLTNVKVDLTVKDTQTGVTKAYHNAAGHVFSTVTDTGAFSGCP